jgi:hypothetical protein
VAQTCRVTHAAPADEPQGVEQIAARLLPAYTVDGGAATLAGCTLEERLLLRLRFGHAGQELEIYLSAEGKEVDGAPIAGPGRVELTGLAEPPGRLGPEVERLLATGARLAAERLPPGSEPELLLATAVWCKHAAGKLRFTIGDAAIEVPFSGWARSLAPPRIVCPRSGTPTFHLAATDDGRLAAAGQIERCAVTGRRMLATELVSCSATGQRVAPELIEVCPVSGRRLLRTAMVQCGMCRERVSDAVVERGLCLACRRLKRVSKADPRMARVLHEHPPLDRWRHWRIAETGRVYVLVATRWIKRLLVVVDKDSLELSLVATGSRLSPRWQPAEPAQYPYILRE